MHETEIIRCLNNPQLFFPAVSLFGTRLWHGHIAYRHVDALCSTHTGGGNCQHGDYHQWTGKRQDL